MASFVTAMPSLVGQPEYDKGKHRYFYDDHGTLIPATRTGYLHAVAAQNRLFLGVALVFLTAAVAITWDERNRRRRFPGPPRGWWHPVRPRPRIPVPGPVLALAAAVGLAGLIACAVLIVSRVDAYNTSGPHLRAGHPVRVLLAPDDYVVFVGCTREHRLPATGARRPVRDRRLRRRPGRLPRSEQRPAERVGPAVPGRAVLRRAEEGRGGTRPVRLPRPARLRRPVAG